MPELKRNILNFGYRINVKYEGMLSHSFDRFYVVTNFILPSFNDVKFSPIDFYSECSYLDADLSRYQNRAQYVSNLKNICSIIVPFIDFYKKKQIHHYNKKACRLLATKYLWYCQAFQKTEKKRQIKLLHK